MTKQTLRVTLTHSLLITEDGNRAFIAAGATGHVVRVNHESDSVCVAFSSAVVTDARGVTDIEDWEADIPAHHLVFDSIDD